MKATTPTTPTMLAMDLNVDLDLDWKNEKTMSDMFLMMEED
jgi:hypothetical protein